MRYGGFRKRRGPESGYILLIFLIILTMMMIAMTAAAPRLAQQLQRDREIEMIHRGEQYERAIKRFYKKFGRYPGRIEDLENTNTIRFLRQRYKDPITGGPWRLVRYGEVQFTQGGATVGIPVQALATGSQASGSASAPATQTSSGGLFNLNFSGGSGQQGLTAAQQQGLATAAAGANIPGNSTATTGGTVNTGTTTDGATTDTTPASGTTDSTSSSTQGSSSLFGQSQTTGTAGQPSSGTTGSSNSLFSSPAGTAQPGAGGGAIIGVASLSKKKGIHEFNKKANYNDWLFVYDPSQDRGQLLRGPYNPNAFVGQATAPAGSTPAGQTPNQSGTGILGSSPSSGFGTPSSGMGQPSAFGSPSSTAGQSSSGSTSSGSQ